MTPLEELQAAHKRMSELRQITNPEKPYRDAWHIVAGRDGFVEIGNYYEDIVSAWGDHSSLPVAERPGELIVTLHRTIDAQLEFLRIAQFLFEWDTGAGPMRAELAIALDLARAINGEASPSQAMSQEEHPS